MKRSWARRSRTRTTTLSSRARTATLSSRITANAHNLSQWCAGTKQADPGGATEHAVFSRYEAVSGTEVAVPHGDTEVADPDDNTELADPVGETKLADHGQRTQTWAVMRGHGAGRPGWRNGAQSRQTRSMRL
ncbi:hypothetical protein PR001_g18090 [Phytophthora rubi]|uniref:Uncharacterized protein n=1 Tax=Phytophthora rubi TaxID=129364 RepID=A0A6A3K798_9STRA|nr:hypothetical protein PR001_g18090 [Phytophthora rubi]